MTVEYIRMVTERYDRLGYPTYRWYRADEPPPFVPLAKPLAKSRIGVLVTAGTYVKGQRAYYYRDDTSFREIPKDVDPADLRFSHLTENYLPDARRDPECMLPVGALAALEADGTIGGRADSYFSCMGGVYSQRRVRDEMIPEITERFAAQDIDAALLIPL
jgi:D-proline reductase (dithiol) PrdB